MHLETGDIIFTSKKSIITKFMNMFQKDPVFWGHVLIVKDNETAWEALYTLRESNIYKRLSETNDWKIIRKTDLTIEQKEKMRKIAPTLLGYPYGVGRIFLQILDHIFYTNWFTKRADIKYIQVCSSYAAWIYWVACRYKFNGVHWMSCEPDDIDDTQIANPNEWRVIYEKGNARRIKWEI